MPPPLPRADTPKEREALKIRTLGTSFKQPGGCKLTGIVTVWDIREWLEHAHRAPDSGHRGPMSIYMNTIQLSSTEYR